jgi:hypothetical protein
MSWSEIHGSKTVDCHSAIRRYSDAPRSGRKGNAPVESSYAFNIDTWAAVVNAETQVLETAVRTVSNHVNLPP